MRFSMTSSLRYAAVALCVALAFTACTKSTQSTATTSDSTQTTAPDANAASSAPSAQATSAGGASAGASQAPAASATTGAMTPSTAVPTANVSTSGSTTGASDGYITLPVYPGATEASQGEMSATTNTGSFDAKIYQTKDDSKTVSDWYKAHLPSSFQALVITANGKTVGTFTDEHKEDNGDQAVLVTYDNNSNETHIQLSTKHGK